MTDHDFELFPVDGVEVSGLEGQLLAGVISMTILEAKDLQACDVVSAQTATQAKE